MELNEIINQKRELHSLVFQYLTNEKDEDDQYQLLLATIERQKIRESLSELRDLILSILIISNIPRQVSFQKVSKLILILTEDLKKFLNSDVELFNFFIKNKRILLLLHENKYFSFDQQIINNMKSQNLNYKFSEYFYPEIKSMIDPEDKKLIEEELFSLGPNIFSEFEEKRLKGENETYICELIRNDSIEQFIEYVSRTNFPLSKKLNHSIFETNHFLIKNQPTPIEYAAFYGSVQICKFLILKDVSLETENVALFAINGGNFDVIHMLESKQIDTKSFNCLGEAIKCRHEDIFNYIVENTNEDKKVMDENIVKSCLEYHNFTFLPDVQDNFFFYLCFYNYDGLVNIFLKQKEKEINDKIKSTK